MTPYTTRCSVVPNVYDLGLYRLVKLIAGDEDKQLQFIRYNLLRRYARGDAAIGWFHGVPLEEPIAPPEGTQKSPPQEAG